MRLVKPLFLKRRLALDAYHVTIRVGQPRGGLQSYCCRLEPEYTHSNPICKRRT